jgi:ABC-type multidrug transport system fused ATPase/permease subunit
MLQEKLAAMDRVFELFDTKPEIVDAPEASTLERCEGFVEFRDVHFGYSADREVLKGISLQVEPGRAVALVGRSGAGKSTLIGLLPRFYDVWDGSVRVDGRDIRDLTLKSLREHIGIVQQESILFSGTIRDNILYGRNNATEEEMRRAARMAHIHDFVETLPLGYATVIGERGVTLSGGQKQRLSIARAFLRDPRILILDEATSNLDSGAELIIQEALRELMRGRTTFVIAHRLSTIVDCDSVLVLQDGCIVQQGSHQELIKLKGPYRQFCKEQFGDVDGLEEVSRKAV